MKSNLKSCFSFVGIVFFVGFLFFLLTAGEARAMLIESAGFNPVTNKIEVTVVYDGGLKNHSFELQWDACEKAHEESNSMNSLYQVAARLVDVSGWDDPGTGVFREELEFELKDPSCRPARMTVISGLHSRVTFEIP
ncbi:MAG: hypothetical protein IPK04_12700 [Bdellovibrionales bacterium]|jgi:hypothetical protein|nr:hypothetical protein [Bdellovibrionales bacterium]